MNALHNILPAQPMNEQQQSAKLQRLGLDFLSSVHWVAIIVVAVLFAGFVVLMRRNAQQKEAVQLKETDDIIEKGREALQQTYFLPTGQLNMTPFTVRSRDAAASADKSGGSSKSVDDNQQASVYATDEINEKINDRSSQKILPQLRRYVKSGKLFSFFNSMASANDKLSQRLQARTKTRLTDDERYEQSLRARYGQNKLRNPLVESQIRHEMEQRRLQKQADTLDEKELEQLDSAFDC